MPLNPKEMEKTQLLGFELIDIGCQRLKDQGEDRARIKQVLRRLRAILALPKPRHRRPPKPKEGLAAIQKRCEKKYPVDGMLLIPWRLRDNESFGNHNHLFGHYGDDMIEQFAADSFPPIVRPHRSATDCARTCATIPSTCRELWPALPIRISHRDRRSSTSSPPQTETPPVIVA